MPFVFAGVSWLATVGFGAALLLVAIAAGRAARSWQRWILLFTELIVGGAIVAAWIVEVWFLAKTLMAVGIAPAPALLIAILFGLILVIPAVALVWVAMVYGYSLSGRRAQLRSDFRRSVWISRGYTFRPDDL